LIYEVKEHPQPEETLESQDREWERRAAHSMI
jgi:hypothetical protein